MKTFLQPWLKIELSFCKHSIPRQWKFWISRFHRLRPNNLNLTIDPLHDDRIGTKILTCKKMVWRCKLDTITCRRSSFWNIEFKGGLSNIICCWSPIFLDSQRNGIIQKNPGMSKALSCMSRWVWILELFVIALQKF